MAAPVATVSVSGGTAVNSHESPTARGDAGLPIDEGGVPRSLMFRAAGRVYACPVHDVREVIPLARTTRLPGSSKHIIGLMNLRGSVVTVVDGSMLLRGVPCDRRTAAVLLVDVGPRGVGFAIDAVSDVRPLRPNEEYSPVDVRAAVARAVIISEDQ